MDISRESRPQLGKHPEHSRIRQVPITAPASRDPQRSPLSPSVANPYPHQSSNPPAMGESRLDRLAPQGETQVLRELVHAIADHHPDPGDPILAARHTLCRSSPDLIGLQPDGRAVY